MKGLSVTLLILIGLTILALALPLVIGIWLPDVILAPRAVIAEATTSSGDRFVVIQYWNRCDFYNTELVHTDSSGIKHTHVLDGDDSKSWSVPISVDESKKQVTVVLSGNRSETIDYWHAQQAVAPYR